MKTELQQLIAGQNLTPEQIHHTLHSNSTGSDVQLGAFLALLAQKKETVKEILAARESCLPKNKPASFPTPALDIVGTGGDGLGYFNVSTAASLLVASCGVLVAKHGGGASSGKVGSMDVARYLNIPMPKRIDNAVSILKNEGFVYLGASLFNPIFAQFSPIRKQLGIPSLLNLIGPLLNPLHPQFMVLGVYRCDLLTVMAEALRQIGVKRALVVHGEEGADELSLYGETQGIELYGGGMRHFVIHPEDVGLNVCKPAALKGGSAEQNARCIRDILLGEEKGARKDMVILNAAAGLMICDVVSDFKSGVLLAREAIESGRSAQFYQRLSGVIHA